MITKEEYLADTLIVYFTPITPLLHESSFSVSNNDDLYKQFRDLIDSGGSVMVWLYAHGFTKSCTRCNGSGRKLRGKCYHCNGRGNYPRELSSELLDEVKKYLEKLKR